jgi:hypothetical protein
MKPTAAEYEAQLEAMAENARRWRAANADKTVLVQFNFPPFVALIAPISVAVKKGFVTTNDAGLELLKALWSWDADTEPTVLMVRAVIEYEKTENQSHQDRSQPDRPPDRRISG